VSVIIPVFNGEKYIREAIRSVFNQTYRNYEIIVVDDGSTDSTRKVINGLKNDSIRYYYQERRGAGSARNTGVMKSKGEFLAFLDADDLWLESKLFSQTKSLRKDATIDMVFTLLEQFVSSDLDENCHKKYLGLLKNQVGVLPSTVLIKKASFYKVGLFESTWNVGEFVDWYARAMNMGLKSHVIDDVLARRRIHGNNISLLTEASKRDYIRILQRKIIRQRDVQ